MSYFRKSKVTASENVKAINAQSSEWFIYDEMTKSGRNAMVKCVSPISGLSVMLFAGPITLEDIKTMSENGNLFVEFTDWLCFTSGENSLGCLLDLRQKWFAQFLCILQNPGQPNDEVTSLNFFSNHDHEKYFQSFTFSYVQLRSVTFSYVQLRSVTFSYVQ